MKTGWTDFYYCICSLAYAGLGPSHEASYPNFIPHITYTPQQHSAVSETPPQPQPQTTTMVVSLLPAELREEIFRECQLEECLALAQTCSVFRATLQALDASLLAKRVMQRVPWMIPGEGGTDLITWADCARVVAARKRAFASGKVTQVELLDDVKPGPANFCELEASVSATVPEDYQPLFDDYLREPYNSQVDKTTFHTPCGYDDLEFLELDLKTLKSSPRQEFDFTKYPSRIKIPDKRNRCIFEWKGMKFLLPNASECVVCHDAYLQVLVRFHVKDDPQSHNVIVNKADTDSDGLLNCITAYRPETKHLKAVAGGVIGVFLNDREHTWVTCYMDLEHKVAVILIRGTCDVTSSRKRSDDFLYIQPHLDIFSYNGILYQRFNNRLIPLMVDLGHQVRCTNWEFLEGMSINWKQCAITMATHVGYRNDWSFPPVVKDDSVHFQGMPEHGLERYIGQHTNPARIVDLCTRQLVATPNPDRDFVFPGISRGELGFWKWPRKVGRRLLRELSDLKDEEPSRYEWDMLTAFERITALDAEDSEPERQHGVGYDLYGNPDYDEDCEDEESEEDEDEYYEDENDEYDSEDYRHYEGDRWVEEVDGDLVEMFGTDYR